jgi:hypothetical protein
MCNITGRAGWRQGAGYQCAGGKPAAHPLHRYITYEKRRSSTRYTPVTCRYTGPARGVAGHASARHRPCAGGKPVAHPLHRYITYEKQRFSTRYTPVTCRYTGPARGGGGRGNGYFATVIDRRYREETGCTPATPLHLLITNDLQLANPLHCSAL